MKCIQEELPEIPRVPIGERSFSPRASLKIVKVPHTQYLSSPGETDAFCGCHSNQQGAVVFMEIHISKNYE